MLNELRDKTERLIRKMRVRRCEIPFVILFCERSGSSHLCSILSNHPQIACRYEDFNEILVNEQNPMPAGAQAVAMGSARYLRRLVDFRGNRTDDPTRGQIIQHFHNIFACRVKACGFKLKCRIQMQLYPEVMKELETLIPDLHVISLQRTNVLKQAISRQNMLRIRAASQGETCNLTTAFQPESGFDRPFHIDTQLVLNHARMMAHDNELLDDSVRRLEQQTASPALNLTYEELLADEAGIARRVFEFLEVDPQAPIYSNVFKATADDLSSVIANFDELRGAVHGTEFESMI